MEIENRNFKKNTAAHLILGIVLVLLGIAVLAEIVDAVPWKMKEIIFSWPMILIVLGLIFISSRDKKSAGIILLVVGGFFILPRFFNVPHYWRSLFWPTVLILLGIVIIFHRSRPVGSHNKKTFDQDFIDDVAIFGGSDRIINSQNFRGGKITHIFGGSKYDFRQAKLAEGKNYLDVLFLFGGTKIIAPEDWDVKIEVTSLFGGFSDKRYKSIIAEDLEHQLIIKGTCLFGGGEIGNI